jgi:hypothetical protein
MLYLLRLLPVLLKSLRHLLTPNKSPISYQVRARNHG